MAVFESIIESVGEIESRGNGLSLMQIVLKGYPDVLYMIDDYTTTQDYINKSVIVDIGTGFVNKEEKPFINNVTVVNKINTLDRIENRRLYPESYPKNECSVNFKDIQIGDPVKRYIVYCTNVSYESSFKSSWMTLTLLDSDWRIAYCKQFTPDSRDTDFVGKYILANIIRTQYGLQTDDFEVIEQLESIKNPRIELARNYVMEVISKDSELLNAVQTSGVIDGILNYSIEEDLEIGYEAVRVANELYVSEELINLSNTVSSKLLNRYIVLSRLYTTSYKETSTLAPEDLNLILYNRLSIASKDVKLLALMSERSRVNLPERDIIKSIRELSKALINSDRTYLYEERRKL